MNEAIMWSDLWYSLDVRRLSLWLSFRLLQWGLSRSAVSRFFVNYSTHSLKYRFSLSLSFHYPAPTLFLSLSLLPLVIYAITHVIMYTHAHIHTRTHSRRYFIFYKNLELSKSLLRTRKGQTPNSTDESCITHISFFIEMVPFQLLNF